MQAILPVIALRREGRHSTSSDDFSVYALGLSLIALVLTVNTLAAAGGAACLQAAHPRPSGTSVQTKSQPVVSALNRHVAPAAPGEVPALVLGRSLVLDPPFLLAPMAGITSAPLRRICAEYGAAMCTSDMLVASSLVQRNKATLKRAAFHQAERVRSAQLYGVRPEHLEEACRFLVQESGVHHIDLNFGCPVRKVTSKGGGSALPLRPRLLARLVRAAVRGAGGEVPLTVKLRVGLSPELVTFMEAGFIAQEEGAAAVTLHARTADQLYAPPADWDAIAELAQSLSVPVIGNGDVFEGADAVQMLRLTRLSSSTSSSSRQSRKISHNSSAGAKITSHRGADGVMLGRAALGRPWLFRDAADMLAGRMPAPPPTLAGALQVALRHLHGWAEWEGDAGGASTVLQMRKLVSLYLLGYSSAGGLQAKLLAAQDVRSWKAAIAAGGYEPDETCEEAALRVIRLKGGGSTGSRKRVPLPAGWLEGRDDDDVPSCLSDEACEG